MNIIVLSGGLSPERNVSLSSASLISAALRRKGHKVLMLDIYEGISDISSDPMELFSTDESEKRSVGEIAPSANDLYEIRKRNGFRSELIGPNVLFLCKLADVAFLALHGDMGENGQLQATLDVFDSSAGILVTIFFLSLSITLNLQIPNCSTIYEIDIYIAIS